MFKLRQKMEFISRSKKITMGISGIILIGIVILIFTDFRYDTHISFSEESGFYENKLELSILGGENNTIYYTLDGSEPTIDDYLYDDNEPIMLTDATFKDNIHSARMDTSTAFFSELIDKYSYSNPKYTIPDYNVDKCNIIRAGVFDEAGNCLESIEGVYFVGFGDKLGYSEIYTASIVTDPDNLFGSEIGIYTTGAAFDEYQKIIIDSQDDPGWWGWWSSNYSNRGIDWERESIVTIFDENKELVLSERCGIRIQGGGSRAKLPKSIGCFARGQYGGSNEFQSDLFQNNGYPHKFVFFSGGDDNTFKLKDYLANTMEQELAFSTMDFIPCAVFLDGEYWGIYYITENYNSDYISDHYEVNKDNVIMIKNGALTEGNEGEEELFWEMREFVSDNDMTTEENYARACEMIDIDSYIDYYAAQIYIARYNDWPGSNEAAWRTRKKEESVYGDCKWRWMLFDVNSGSLSLDQVDVDTFFNVVNGDSMFHALYMNEDFRVKFADRILHIGKEIFSEEKCEIFLDDYAEKMREPIEISNLRFYNNKKSDEFNENVDSIRTFFAQRYDVIWDSLVNNMGEAWLEQNGIQK